jgi:hypothetical protein
MTRAIIFNLGAAHSGLAANATYEVRSPNLAIVRIDPTNAGVTENPAGSGVYIAAVTFDPTWAQVVVIWRLTGTTISATLPLDAAEGSGFSFDTSAGPQGGFTYNPAAVATTPLNWIRWRLGDVVSATSVLGDAEILQTVSQFDLRSATIACANAAAAVMIRRAEFSQNDQTKIQYYNRAEFYRMVASDLVFETLPIKINDAPIGFLTVGSGKIELPEVDLR